MKISVIIPSFNEENSIGECLESLLKQTYKDLEIIVIDDGSTDKTKSLVAQYSKENPKITLLKADHKGPGPARNLGASHSSGKILVFVDSDMTFEPDFIKKLVDPIVAGNTKGTFSKEEYVAKPENVWSKCWTINEGWEEDKRHPKNYPNKQKVFRAILKSEFDKVGGFTPTGEYTDDWTLSEKLGYLADSAPAAVFYHKNPESLAEVFNQAKWIGKRKYKLGALGKIIAAVRASLPISAVVGIWKSVVHNQPAFFVFKLAYDFGVFSGAISSLLGGSSAK
ncbi:MAG: glycosyltransferase family 2 protein [Patescibacteria group bacterium]